MHGDQQSIGIAPLGLPPASLPDDLGDGLVPLESAALYRRHADFVKRWVQRLGGPLVDVEDAVHEVFLVAHRRLPEWRGDAKVTTWLYRITERVVRKQGRKQRIRGWLRGLTGDFVEHTGDELPGPYEAIERKQALGLMHRALDGIDGKYRTVVLMYELQGLSGEQIADLTGTKLATVWVWLHRGRAKFVQRLRELQDVEAREVA
jgi:RNA polymerase sigma-70 factor (ECF subfamily)